MTEKAKKQQVILKRNIITKAVVTPKFKTPTSKTDFLNK